MIGTNQLILSSYQPVLTFQPYERYLIDFEQHRLYKKQNKSTFIMQLSSDLTNIALKVELGWRSAMSLIRPCKYPYTAPIRLVEILIDIITRSHSLIFTTTVGSAIMPLLCLVDSGVTLEPTEQHLSQIPLVQRNALYVNPTVGDKTIENGSEGAPFKTITQALRVAQPNTVIILKDGTYSSSSGETFPLQLKSGVSIQGDPRTRGSNIVIKGGGTFLSPTFARQNITILGANQAGVSGVTVTNPNPRGYGLWIESTSPMVVDNTFTGNNHDGISITGNSAPTIRSNYFYQNGANGMTIYGTSRPLVRENVFEKTGFGINIAQKAAPVLVGNRIIQNRSGIVTQAKARPVLRGNVIEGNTEDGLVAIATSQPDLGTTTEPGKNVFRQNGRYDINNSASSQVISAFGNQLVSSRTSGRIDGTGSPQTLSTNNTAASFPTPSSLVSSETKPVAIPVSQSERAELSPSVGEQTPVTTTMAPITIPVPPPASTNLPTPPHPPQPVALPLPQSGASQKNLPLLKPAPVVVSELLPVPSSNIPIGNSRKQPKLAMHKKSLTPSYRSQLPLTRTTELGLRYRVVVEAHSESEQSTVRSLVPGAFRTVANGRVLMQAGAFSDRANADEIQQLLSSKGFKAKVEQLN